jgi:hypothetical protein
MDVMRSPHTLDLTRRIEKAGYYPELVADSLDLALAGEDVAAHLVHAETTFDSDTVRRHLSVLVLTATRLVFVHADDHGDDEHEDSSHAIASSEAIPLSSVRSVMLTHVVAEPERYKTGELGREITLTVSWGAVSRIDLEPATCGDPNCDADHGYAGTITGDDLSLRVSAEAEGRNAVSEALAFARALSAATAAQVH